MKVFHKDIRKIIIDGSLFYYIVDEKGKEVKFRAYSGKYKTSFFEVSFSWVDNWYVNFYKPKTAAKVIKYALESGWLVEKQIVKLSDGKFLIQELEIHE